MKYSFRNEPSTDFTQPENIDAFRRGRKPHALNWAAPIRW